MLKLITQSGGSDSEKYLFDLINNNAGLDIGLYAIEALGSLKTQKATDYLIKRMNNLLDDYEEDEEYFINAQQDYSYDDLGKAIMVGLNIQKALKLSR